MALIPQTEDGLTANANCYGNMAFLVAYWTERGYTFPVANPSAVPPVTQPQADAIISAAGVKATDFMDGRWTFVGERQSRDQTTEWPRTRAWDRDNHAVYGIPLQVKQAWAEYTLIAANGGDLEAVPERDTTGSRVLSKSEAVGPISQSVTYAAGGGYRKPVWPIPDGILKKRGLVLTSGRTIRG